MQEPGAIKVLTSEAPFNTVNQRPELEHIDVLWRVKGVGMSHVP